MLFINCHLAAGQKHNKKRNIDFKRINTELDMNLDNKTYMKLNETITDQFDFCVWLGDLNYRINLPCDNIYTLLVNKKIDNLLEHDQLFEEILNNRLEINSFYEQRINFFPTYKFQVNTDYYDIGSKQPGWTDRIIYKTKLDQQLTVIKYSWIKDIQSSDHKPVIAEFLFNVKLEEIENNSKNIKNIIGEDGKSKACIIY